MSRQQNSRVIVIVLALVICLLFFSLVQKNNKLGIQSPEMTEPDEGVELAPKTPIEEGLSSDSRHD